MSVLSPRLVRLLSLQQSGLITRVTDTVKSIVPSWLQKYFKAGDAAEEAGAVQGAEQGDQTLPPNGSEEGPPPHDGWDSPEPSTSHTGEGSSRPLGPPFVSCVPVVVFQPPFC